MMSKEQAKRRAAEVLATRLTGCVDVACDVLRERGIDPADVICQHCIGTGLWPSRVHGHAWPNSPVGLHGPERLNCPWCSGTGVADHRYYTMSTPLHDYGASIPHRDIVGILANRGSRYATYALGINWPTAPNPRLSADPKRKPNPMLDYQRKRTSRCDRWARNGTR